MNPDQATQYGQLVQAAYAVDPSDLTNRAQEIIDSQFDPLRRIYQIVTTIYSNDLATDLNPERGDDIVSLGYIAQDDSNNIVISIRGTEGIWEWIHDAEFLSVKCPFLPGAGNTEDGFTAIYQSLRIGSAASSSRVLDALAALPFRQPVGTLTVCGHSLSGAVATLLALDIAANTAYKNVSVYTYASPRTGDPLFASTYNQVVPDSYRFANRVDIVDMLPPPPFYEHVAGLCDLNPISFGLPPKVLIKFDVGCEHSMNSYLYLISLLPGATIRQILDQQCSL